MVLDKLLLDAVQKEASDIFIIPGAQPSMKIKGRLTHVDEIKLLPGDTKQILGEIYALAQDRDMSRLVETGDDDFSFSVAQIGRFRCNAYKQRGSLAAVLRVVTFGLPNHKEYHIPQRVMDVANVRRGLVLVTGPAGSGKSTTLGCIIDRINTEKSQHIITIEDPIEYLHPHKKSIVSQREIEHDTQGYTHALRAALRQAPDVILLGEMRDFDTIQTALTAAETGHVVFSTLHTVGAAKTIDRVIDVFPANQQQQTRIQLSMVLQAVISQQLVPTLDGGLIPAFEIMLANSAIQNTIREGKTFQLDNAIYAGASQGMITMDAQLLNLYKEKIISSDTALLYSSNPDAMKKRML